MFTSGEGEVKIRGVRWGWGVAVGDFSVKAGLITGAAAAAYCVKAVSASFLTQDIYLVKTRARVIDAVRVHPTHHVSRHHSILPWTGSIGINLSRNS